TLRDHRGDRGGQGDPEQGQHAGGQHQQPENRTRQGPRPRLVRPLVEGRVYGNERPGECALAEQIADGVRDSEGGAEGIRRDAVIAEVMREHPLAHIPEDPRHQDAPGDLRRVTPPPPPARPPALPQEGPFFLPGPSSRRRPNCSSSRLPTTERVRASRSGSYTSPPSPPLRS